MIIFLGAWDAIDYINLLLYSWASEDLIRQTLDLVMILCASLHNFFLLSCGASWRSRLDEYYPFIRWLHNRMWYTTQHYVTYQIVKLRTRSTTPCHRSDHEASHGCPLDLSIIRLSKSTPAPVRMPFEGSQLTDHVSSNHEFIFHLSDHWNLRAQWRIQWRRHCCFRSSF